MVRCGDVRSLCGSMEVFRGSRGEVNMEEIVGGRNRVGVIELGVGGGVNRSRGWVFFFFLEFGCLGLKVGVF